MNRYYTGLSDDEKTIYVKRDLEHVFVDVWDTTPHGRRIAEQIADMLDDYAFSIEGEKDD